MLVLPEGSSAVLVMMRSKSVSIIRSLVSRQGQKSHVLKGLPKSDAL